MKIDELCYKVIGAAMAVHRHFGPGYLEEVYKNALMGELEMLGVQSDKEVPIAVNYKGVRVGDYRADVIIDNNATGIEDGFLINFGATSLQHKHKYRVYRQPQAHNPVNPVNPV